MAEIKPYPIPGRVKCFQDEGEMEFIMPDSQTQDYISFRCQICRIIYQIPVSEVDKRIRVSLEIKPQKEVKNEEI